MRTIKKPSPIMLEEGYLIISMMYINYATVSGYLVEGPYWFVPFSESSKPNLSESAKPKIAEKIPPITIIGIAASIELRLPNPIAAMKKAKKEMQTGGVIKGNSIKPDSPMS